MLRTEALDHRSRRAEILGLLRAADEPLAIAALAAGVGIHANTVRFHLDALIEQGSVLRTLAPPVGRGRPRALYAPRPGMDRTGARHYESLSRVLIAALAIGPAPEQHALALGRSWGAEMVPAATPDPDAPPDAAADDPAATLDAPPDVAAAVTTVTTLLADLDFAPRHVPGVTADDPGHLRLEHCPFLELAEDFGPVVCSLHLGLVQGALATLDAPLRAESITPFAEPAACLVGLAAGAEPR